MTCAESSDIQTRASAPSANRFDVLMIGRTTIAGQRLPATSIVSLFSTMSVMGFVDGLK